MFWALSLDNGRAEGTDTSVPPECPFQEEQYNLKLEEVLRGAGKFRKVLESPGIGTLIPQVMEHLKTRQSAHLII
jgi:hypothetical protein